MDMYSEYEVQVSELRSRPVGVLETASQGERIFVIRAGRRIAALVPVEDVGLIEEVEDAYWAERAKPALSAQGDKPGTSLEALMTEVGHRREIYRRY
ncbi:type II toxin-antitoxin system prevent-host-death family antitoxin [Haloglycomyces albus]|uniref:type II toxin-antitoxin system prevent-host-death family antitoxin n=1 Tax=Haloglycomyces albus TaxID=526067 RepID=UPI00046D0604|nr:type II toxin-antitoxin system prevent-host-death family antitoxin [Haloglycomyces albus]